MAALSDRGLYELKGGYKSLLHRDKDQCSARVPISGDRSGDLPLYYDNVYFCWRRCNLCHQPHSWKFQCKIVELARSRRKSSVWIWRETSSGNEWTGVWCWDFVFDPFVMKTGVARSYETLQPTSMWLSVRGFSSRTSHPKEEERKVEVSTVDPIYIKQKAKLGPLIEAHLSVLIEFN
jgi:hypothetical protein